MIVNSVSPILGNQLGHLDNGISDYVKFTLIKMREVQTINHTARDSDPGFALKNGWAKGNAGAMSNDKRFKRNQYMFM